MTLIEALEILEDTPLGDTRIVKLKELAEEIPEQLRWVMDATANGLTTFGIKKLPEPPTMDNRYTDLAWVGFTMDICRKLSTRQMTGNCALDEVAKYLGECTPIQRKWAERILLRDLRLGLKASSINKALPGCVFQFKVPLAVDYKKAKPEWISKHTWVATYKYDGARCVTYLVGDGTGQVNMYSRSGKLWENFESVKRVLGEWNRGRTGPTLVLDGEVVSLDDKDVPNFNMIQQTMHAKKRGTEIGRLHYVVFDYSTLDEWAGDVKRDRPYTERLEAARGFCHMLEDNGCFQDLDRPNISVAPTMREEIKPGEATEELLLELNRAAVEHGYEGAMVRRADSLVDLKRSKDLLKIKAFSDSEATVVGSVEGTGKYEGMLGTLVCRTADGQEFEIGSGYSDAERGTIWGERESLAGKLAKYKYFELSKDGIPRFPIFLGFRHESDI